MSSSVSCSLSALSFPELDHDVHLSLPYLLHPLHPSSFYLALCSLHSPQITGALRTVQDMWFLIFWPQIICTIKSSSSKEAILNFQKMVCAMYYVSNTGLVWFHLRFLKLSCSVIFSCCLVVHQSNRNTNTGQHSLVGRNHQPEHLSD